MNNQSEATTWRDGVPISARFDDPYYSLQDGLDETNHVFVRGNRLPDRMASDLHIAELGFGTGLGFLAAWEAWRAAPVQGALRFTTFEAFPMSLDAQAKALRAFPTLAPLANRLMQALATGDPQIAPGVTLTVIPGDARTTVPLWRGSADAWFLDGFSPAKNPELWHPDLMRAVYDHTAPGGSFATYTAAGHVRRSLADAGFAVTRVPGFGRKRHMTIGTRP